MPLKFHELVPADRQKQVQSEHSLSDEAITQLNHGGMNLERADKLIENAIGLYALPLGIVKNVLIDGERYDIPMVTEEPSIIAGASKAGKLMSQAGGITTKVDEPIATAQIQLLPQNGNLPSNTREKIINHEAELIGLANQKLASLVARGGGVREIRPQASLKTKQIDMLIVHVEIDTRDAMGANIASATAEYLAPYLEKLTDTRANLRILTNLTTHRLARASVNLPAHEFSQNTLANVTAAQAMANHDIYRAATHNKGIMNGIDAVALATGNDTRAIEAGAHAYATMSGSYQPLSHWEHQEDVLRGDLTLPLAVGVIGGLTRHHEVVKTALEIMRVKTSTELASVMVAIGLAQNFAALLALSTTGISDAHLPLHNRRQS
jgi:hydroxymethylglutaryl-CoA reductase